MVCVCETITSYVRNYAKKCCGSLKNAAIILAVTFGSTGLVAGGVDPRYDFVPLVVTRAANLLFWANLALLWGILLGRTELLLGYLAAAAISIPTSVLGIIVSCFVFYYLDPTFIALAITFSVVIPIHMTIVHGLVQEMKGGETSSPSKDGWVQQNLTVGTKEELKEKENLVQLPAVFTPVNSAQIA